MLNLWYFINCTSVVPQVDEFYKIKNNNIYDITTKCFLCGIYRNTRKSNSSLRFFSIVKSCNSTLISVAICRYEINKREN
jgi:hypothetical protein